MNMLEVHLLVLGSGGDDYVLPWKHQHTYYYQTWYINGGVAMETEGV